MPLPLTFQSGQGVAGAAPTKEIMKLKQCQNESCSNEIKKPREMSKKRYEEKRFCCSKCAYEQLRREKRGAWNPMYKS